MKKMNTKNKINTNTQNLNKMKNNYLKLGMMAVIMLSVSVLSAQTTTGDIAPQANINYGTTTTGGAIKVIDNKGTIKYIQTTNGITTLTNTTANITTTTFQLGGTLVAATNIATGANELKIDVAGGTFIIDNLLQESGTAATALDGVGYTLLTRDEATGETKRMLLEDLIESGHQIFSATANQTTYSLAITTETLSTFSKVWVYRNGAKLLAGADYTVSTSDNDIELVPNPGVGVSNWSVYANDVIEVQYIK